MLNLRNETASSFAGISPGISDNLFNVNDIFNQSNELILFG